MRQEIGGGGRPSVGNVALRRRVLLCFWLLAGGGLLWRSVDLQLVQAHEWRAEAERQHRTTGIIPAARGMIMDRAGRSVALSHETFRVSVAPHEVRDTTATVERLSGALGISAAQARAPFQSSRRWVQLQGRFPPGVRDTLAGTRGVYVERELRRFYPHNDLLRGVLGAVIDGQGAGGVEQAFEEELAGTPGSEILARDSQGRPIPGDTWVVEPPRSGGQVVLTLDADLQEIAHQALQQALDETGARGGDLLVTDPRSGEILAMASLKDGASTHLGAINAPYEPGSILKPFTVATLLSTGRATLADSVDAGNGQWRKAGRTITDVHSPGHTDLAHALQVSSNVAIAKVADRLTPAEQYEGLRDFGLGAPTGIDLPGEVAGSLRRPQRWSAQSPASLAIGYEVGVTPLQMAMAYGALANGGTLMEPRIIREVRDSAGRTLQSFEPRAVRRVVSAEVAREITDALVGAVEDGTGGRARLSTFQVAGKSGTSRAHAGGVYEQGAYFASFAGFFPAEDPQLVVFVKLDRPQGEYYGGATAAPVTRATMEAILATHAPPLDRRALASLARRQAIPGGMDAGSNGMITGPAEGIVGPGAGTSRFVARSGPERPPAPDTRTSAGAGFTLPDLAGSTPRGASRHLHGLGLVVEWTGGGSIGATDPAAGSRVSPGDTIRLLGPPGRRVAAGRPSHE